MVVLNKIYTRTGDSGTTALGTGERVPKQAPRIWAYGTVDETNAQVGMARLSLGEEPALDAALARVQNDLFDLGADLCIPDRGAPPSWAGPDYQPLRISAAQVKRLENEIDSMNEALEPLRSFVLPGGTPAAAALHVARTVCRRAERHMAELASLPDEPVSDDAMRYINRLSDYLFVASRYLNARSTGDVLWVPGANR
ncbi:MAG: cob(I)yrinic acid a,c-diamide adenosyltransferase [Hyphomicrobiaceae bacterium]